MTGEVFCHSADDDDGVLLAMLDATRLDGFAAEVEVQNFCER